MFPDHDVSSANPNETPAPDDDPLSLDFTVPGVFCELAARSTPSPSLVDRAAALRADGQAAQACALLEPAVQAGDDFGGDAERAWTLLLDLYQATGRRQDFDARALAFAARFEKSPPTWVESGPAAAAPAGKVVAVSLAGTLNARVETPLQQVLKICAKNPVQIDLSRIADVEDRGCELLLAALDTCRRTRSTCLLAGAGHLADLLAGRMRTGGRANEHAWLLLLDLYQRLGRQEAFEDAAVAYAVTFELSPPSWDPARVGGGEN